MRFLEHLPLGPLWLWLGLAAAIVALHATWIATSAVVFGRESLVARMPEGADLIIACLISFVVAVGRYESRGTHDNLARLQPLTRLTEAGFARIATPPAASRMGLRVAEGIGAAVGMAMIPASVEDPAFLLRAEEWSAQLVWALLANAVLFALMARGVYYTVLSRGLSERITREIVRIDLLDRSALAPFARQGLLRALFWAGGSSIASLLALDLQRIWALFAILALTLLMATLARLQPVRAIHARLVEAKRAELARIRAEIQRVKEVALGPRRAGRGADALPGLLAYESRIEAVSEWPFDTPTRLRFGALMLLAAGSWLGGAVVERLLGSVLD